MFHHWLMHSIKRKIIITHIKQYMLLLNMNGGITTKVNTYYESLGIPVTATYDEIKAAYYKLTLQYHPDRNKSEVAKHKFHEISNAYDILSKYESRKQYDKSILAGNKNVNFIKQKMAPASSAYYRGTTMYNFDKWLKMHYTLAFEEILQKKHIKKKEKKKEDELIEDKIIIICSIVIIILPVIGIYYKEKQV